MDFYFLILSFAILQKVFCSDYPKCNLPFNTYPCECRHKRLSTPDTVFECDTYFEKVIEEKEAWQNLTNFFDNYAINVPSWKKEFRHLSMIWRPLNGRYQTRLIANPFLKYPVDTIELHNFCWVYEGGFCNNLSPYETDKAFLINGNLNFHTRRFYYIADNEEMSVVNVYDMICLQFANLTDIKTDFLYSAEELVKIETKTFISCINSSNPLKDVYITSITPLWIQNHSFANLLYPKMETNIFYLQLNFTVGIIEDFAFSITNKNIKELAIIFENSLATSNISEKAFLVNNVKKTHVVLYNPSEMLHHSEAIKRFLDLTNNQINFLNPDTVLRLSCNCEHYWLYQRKDQINVPIIRGKTIGFLCRNGTSLFDLRKEFFIECDDKKLTQVITWYGRGLIALLLLLKIAIFSSLLISFTKSILYPRYKMDQKPRGLCLIINNCNFENQVLSNRNGSEIDVLKLQTLFETHLNFDVRIEKDKTIREIRVLLNSIKDLEIIKGHDAFVCVVMSHGSSGDLIYGVDGTTIKVHDIVKYFNDQNCVGLRGKPKLFFINACRGESFDNGRNNKQILLPKRLQEECTVCDGKEQQSNTCTMNEYTTMKTVQKDGPSWQDILLVYSSVYEHASARHVTQGSWFIDSLTSRLKKMANKSHLEEILKKVTEDMKKRTAMDTKTGRPIYVVPVIEKRAFTKLLYFKP